jgi:hypothetical protein
MMRPAILVGDIQAQIRALESGFHRQVGICIGRWTVLQHFFGPLPGSLSAGDIDLFHVFRSIRQDGNQIRLNFHDPTGNGEYFFLALAADFANAVF